MEEHNRIDDTKIAILEERVTRWMESTTDYRKSLCSKMDKICEKVDALTDTVNKLPCDARLPMWESLNYQIKTIWGFIGAIVLAIIIEWIRRA